MKKNINERIVKRIVEDVMNDLKRKQMNQDWIDSKNQDIYDSMYYDKKMEDDYPNDSNNNVFDNSKNELYGNIMRNWTFEDWDDNDL